MRDIPVNLSGYRLMVTEAPAMKMRERNGATEPVTDRQGVAQFVVSLFAKRRPGPDGFAGKGEEIRVTLTADPGEGFEEGAYVELIDPRVSPFSLTTEDGRTISGLSFRAAGLVAASPVRSVA
jgi:hypothetical protein